MELGYGRQWVSKGRPAGQGWSLAAGLEGGCDGESHVSSAQPTRAPVVFLGVSLLLLVGSEASIRSCVYYSCSGTGAKLVVLGVPGTGGRVGGRRGGVETQVWVSSPTT